MKSLKLFFLIVTLNLIGLCQAQEWPNKPIQMIVQFPPGTTTDSVARDLAGELSKELAQNSLHSQAIQNHHWHHWQIHTSMCQ